MPLCKCDNGPRCEYHHCNERADWSIHMPPTRWYKTWPHGRFKFMCDRCWNIYYEALVTPMKGIDPPENTPDDWRPSLMDHIRHAEIAIAFEERHKTAQPSEPMNVDSMDGYWERHYQHLSYTLAQRKQSIIWRRAVSQMKRDGLIR